MFLPSGSKCVILSHSGHQEALREDEAESGSVPLPGPHVCQPKAVHQGTGTCALVVFQHIEPLQGI